MSQHSQWKRALRKSAHCYSALGRANARTNRSTIFESNTQLDSTETNPVQSGAACDYRSATRLVSDAAPPDRGRRRVGHGASCGACVRNRL